MKNITIQIIGFMLLSFFFLYVMREEIKKNSSENLIYNDQLAILKHKNDSLKKCIESKLYEIKTMQTKIDSFEQLKPQIEIRYVEKLKKIENASAIDVYNDFKHIFADNNIK